MPGIFVRMLPNSVPSDFCKTLFLNSAYLSALDHDSKPFGFSNIIEHTAGSRAIFVAGFFSLYFKRTVNKKVKQKYEYAFILE